MLKTFDGFINEMLNIDDLYSYHRYSIGNVEYEIQTTKNNGSVSYRGIKYNAPKTFKFWEYIFNIVKDSDSVELFIDGSDNESENIAYLTDLFYEYHFEYKRYREDTSMVFTKRDK